MRRRRLAILGAGVALAVALIAWRGTGGPPAPAPGAPPVPPAPVAAGRAPVPAIAGAPAAAEAPPGPLPASLEGTEADGAITADTDGHVVVDLELRRLFDHFLAATGEAPPAALRALIVARLRARLPAAAADEAIAILDRYLAYRDAARRLATPADPRAGLAAVHDLRVQILSPEVARAFFAAEEAAIRAAFDRRDVAADPSLAPAERERRLAELERQMPAAERAARAAATAPLDQMNREQAMRAAVAGDAEIAAARTASLGAEAAARLAGLDRARAAWAARLATFRAQRAQLIADPALDDAERRRRIDALLAQSFTPEERIRIEALDRISVRPAP